MVKILHLYPNLMNLYGDYANITVLKKHLEDQGIKVKVDTKDIEQNINLDKYDMIYMGSGTESNLKVALYDLMRYKNIFKLCVNKGKTILFTGNAMELLGNYIDNAEALGIFDFETKHTDLRFTGDVIVKNEETGYVVGFINRSTVIKGGEFDRLFDYVFKDEDLLDNYYEGCHFNNTYGTHIIGPVLVKNPDFLNVIMKSVCPKKFNFKNIRYDYEIEGYITTLEALKDRIK